MGHSGTRPIQKSEQGNKNGIESFFALFCNCLKPICPLELKYQLRYTSQVKGLGWLPNSLPPPFCLLFSKDRSPTVFVYLSSLLGFIIEVRPLRHSSISILYFRLHFRRTKHSPPRGIISTPNLFYLCALGRNWCPACSSTNVSNLTKIILGATVANWFSVRSIKLLV